jgi:hypothetical protein
MDENLSNTSTSFVNLDWILNLCEQEILNEQMIHEGIGGRINMIGQAELRGYIRAIRKVQELILLPIIEDVATLSCNDFMLDENGDIIILDGRMKMLYNPSEIEPSFSPQEIQVFLEQLGATPHPVIPLLRAPSSVAYRK